MPGASSWKGMSVMTPGGTAAELYFQSMLTLHHAHPNEIETNGQLASCLTRILLCCQIYAHLRVVLAATSTSNMRQGVSVVGERGFQAGSIASRWRCICMDIL